MSLDEVVEVLCGPPVDADGRAYFLGGERDRSIVCRKGAGGAGTP